MPKQNTSTKFEPASVRQTGRTHKLITDLIQVIVGKHEEPVVKGRMQGYFVCPSVYFIEYALGLAKKTMTYNGVLESNINSLRYTNGRMSVKFLNDYTLHIIAQTNSLLISDHRTGQVRMRGDSYPVVLDHMVTVADISPH